MEQIEKIREKILLDTETLNMNQVPKNISKQFKEMAKQEFANHYGLTLKYLLDFYNGLLPKGNEVLEGAIVALEQRIIILEGKSKDKEETPQERFSKRLNGQRYGKVYEK